MSLQRVEIISEFAILLFSTNILRFKLLGHKSWNNLSIVPWPLCDRNFPVECPNQSHPKNGKIQTYFFHFISHPYISCRNNSSAYIPFLIIFFTYTFTYLLYEGSSMKFWSTGVPCLDVMGLDTPLESFCHTEGTVDK